MRNREDFGRFCQRIRMAGTYPCGAQRKLILGQTHNIATCVRWLNVHRCVLQGGSSR